MMNPALPTLLSEMENKEKNRLPVDAGKQQNQ